MAFSTFSAQGRVKSIEVKTTRAGKDFTVIVLDVGNERYAHELEVTAWYDAAEACSGIREGDEVAVSGRLDSPENDRGYRNTHATAQTINVVAPAQQSQPAPQPEQSFTAAPATSTPAAAVYNEDIPFDRRSHYGA
jgi:single-stranded DNA-binding protein